ncbi:hypothetical protein BC941DRAFT_454668 [Chlamydoabsidia padenii]|nr:hypothetical protein BC941DRAFT_454668 [Chlamydoabsidia padenii]
MAQKDETIIQHRFVQVQQTTLLAPDKVDKLWKILGGSDLSTIAISSACDKVVMAVKTSKLDFFSTIQHYQNLVLITSEPARLGIFMRSITQLVLWKATQSTDLAGLHSGNHPFVWILRQRPQLYYDLLVEADFCLNQCKDSFGDAIFQALVPFYDSVFLMNLGDIDSAALLNRFNNLLMVDDDHSVEMIIHYLLDVCRRYPSQYSQHNYLSIVDTVINALTFNTTLHQTQDFEDLTLMTNDLVYMLLQRAYDASMQQNPTLSYVNRLEKVMAIEELVGDNKITIASPNFYLVWCSLSYLLLTASTVDDQYALVGLMELLVNLEQCQSDIMMVALLPLFQTLAELQDNVKSLQLKTVILGLVSTINQHGITSFADSTDIIKKINKEVDSHHISGNMCHMVPYLLQYLDRKSVDSKQQSPETVSYTHSILFCVPLLFNNNASIRVTYLDEIVHLLNGSQEQTSLKFPVLMVLIYLMQHSAVTTDTLLYILHHSIPALVSTNDPVTTTKILHITKSLIHGTKDLTSLMNTLSHTTRETTMSSIGLKIMEKLHDKQPRIWQELRKVLSDWILRRKLNNGRGNLTEIDKTGSTQMELSILTTMRDLCLHHPRECAPDILPMLISLLQTCQYVHVGSLSIIVQAMCACVNAGMAEPRSLWLVAVSYIAQFGLQVPVDQSSLLLRRLCEFFEITGKKDDLSEPYSEFKQVILNDYLAVLIHSSDASVKKSALRALSFFPVPDILPLLPEKAKQYLDDIYETGVNMGHTDVLVSLMSHELDHMRRGFFLDEHGGSSNKKDNTSGDGILSNSKEDQIGGQFVAAWENARISPGLRSGYSMAVLQGAQHHLNPEIQANTMETMTKTKWYRCLGTCLGDIGLTDHLLVRVSSPGAWQVFFGAIMVGNEGDVENRAMLLLKDLLARLDKSTVPGHTCNIFLALTGMIATVHNILPSCAAACATQLIDILTTKYIIHGDIKPNSLLLTSEEVQYGARYCLGHVAECIVVNDKMATRVLNILLQLATQCRPSKRNLNTAVDLIHFSSGYAAAHFSSVLATWSTKSSAIEVLAVHGTSELLSYCGGSADILSDSACLGIMMGWASKFDSLDLGNVSDFACQQLDAYANGESVNLGLLLGAPWICSYGAYDDNGGLNKEMVDTLAQAAAIAHTDESFAGQLYHFDVPFSRLARLQHIAAGDNESSTSFSNLFLSTIQTIQTDDASSQLRIPALFSLGCLLGTDYLHTPIQQDQLVKEAQQYNADIRRPLLDVITTLAGLTDGLSAGNLKSGRIAAVVCGEIVQASQKLQVALKSESGLTKMTMSISSAEPKSYSRLNNNTSHLRAVFDTLTDQHYGTESYVQLLLSALRDTPGPLPAVNWFPLLSKLVKISTTIHLFCISFATNHATTSLSLSEFILSELGQTAGHYQEDIANYLVGESGIGKLLELSGLGHHSGTNGYKRRGMDAVTKKMTVSDIRAIEIFEGYAKLFVKLPDQSQNLFLSTVKDHLPTTDMDEAKMTYVSSLRDIIRYNITYRLLDDPDTNLNTLCLAVNISINNMNDLLQGVDMKDWINDKSTAHIKTKAILEVCHLQRTQQPTPRYITDLITHLLFLFDGEATGCWNILSQTIAYTLIGPLDRLAWVIRLLDVLIVVIGMKKQISMDVIRIGIETMIRQGLETLWSGSLNVVLPGGVALADTGYLMAYSISMAKGQDHQRQIVKRVLKLIDLLSGNDCDDDAAMTIKDMFVQVLRDCPKEVVIEHRAQLQDIIPFE